MLIDDAVQAAKDGDAGVLKRLFSEDPGLVNARASSGETPLMSALYRGHHGCVETIVGAGATLDVFAAAALGRVDALGAALLAGDRVVNSYAYDGWTPLHLAAFFGHREAAERLLAAGADLTAVSQNALRNTPLHAAVAGGHSDAALLLIERSAPVDVADAGGHTPLHIAAEAGYVPVAQALLARGADPHAVDREDQTPLSRAAARGHTQIVDLMNLPE